MATRLLASPRVLREWKQRTRALCDSSGMWSVSSWVKRFATVLRLSGASSPPISIDARCLQMSVPHPSPVDLHFAASQRSMHAVGAQMDF